MSQNHEIAAFFRDGLLDWFRRHKRDLPWRSESDPYRIWVSEIMLQQTRVDTVIPYYERFIRQYPTLDALADANDVTVSEQELSERIVFQASQYGMPPEEFVRRLQEAGQLGVLYADARRSKALIQAVRQATVVDTAGAPVDLSEFLGPDEDAPGSSTESSTEASTEAAAEDSSDDAAQAPAASGPAS